MFYLNEFGKLFKANLVLSLILSISILGLLSVSHQRDSIVQEFALSQKTKNIPYFNALIAKGTNLDGVRRKMLNLPGVFNIVVDENKNINSELDYLKKSFGTEMISQLASLKYKKMKIQFEEGVNEKNQNLVREYLARLVGKESVTIGAIKTPRSFKLKKDDFLATFLQYVDIYLMGIFFSLLVMSLFLIQRGLKNQAYIIEKFQRRDMVGLKIILSGILFLSGIAIVINLAMHPQVNLFGIVSLVLIIAISTMMSFRKQIEYKV